MGELQLRLEQVTLAYGDRVVLDRVSLEAPPGQVTGIVGPNGCGKSTLIKGVTRVLAARAGRIFIDGKTVDQVSRGELARLVAVVAQNAALPDLFTAFELVLLGRTPHLGRFRYESETDIGIVWRAMEMTDTAALARRRVGELSGGERQRLCIARALAQQPKILLLDEPTAHLDISHQAQALDLVSRLCREENLVVVAALHDLNLAAQYCRRVIMLSRGGVYRQGTPEEVLTAENIKEVYGANVIIQRHLLTGAPLAFAVPNDGSAAGDSTWKG